MNHLYIFCSEHRCLNNDLTPCSLFFSFSFFQELDINCQDLPPPSFFSFENLSNEKIPQEAFINRRLLTEKSKFRNFKQHLIFLLAAATKFVTATSTSANYKYISEYHQIISVSAITVWSRTDDGVALNVTVRLFLSLHGAEITKTKQASRHCLAARGERVGLDYSYVFGASCALCTAVLPVCAEIADRRTIYSCKICQKLYKINMKINQSQC